MTLEVRISASTDDAEERNTGKVKTASSDLELVFDRTGDQTVGMRFNGINIPQGANITYAYIQFQADEANSVATSLIIEGEDVDNATMFTTVDRSISSRPRTTATVSWSPAPWLTRGEAGPDQQTPNIASVIQEIVTRPGWASGNSLVIIVSGTGERTAESFNGLPVAAPLLHVEYNTGPVTNQPPSVSAGPDQTITLLNDATLDGTVTDDGLPNPPSTVTVAWSVGSGPGVVTFTDPYAIDTTASFSISGTYVLRLTANDSEFSVFDATTVFVNTPPVLVSPAHAATGVSTSPTLEVTVSDPEGDNLTVTFYGRPKTPGTDSDFTLIALPDTQHYTDNPANEANFSAQTQWIVDNRIALNIPFVTHPGDVVQNGNNSGDDSEWLVADAAMSLLEDPVTTQLADGIPFGVAPGDSDQGNSGGTSTGPTASFNNFFGVSRFQGRSYYGGHYGTLNDNNFELFSASGYDFIIVHFEYDSSPPTEVLNWADNLLQTYSNRRAIVVTHYMIDKGNPGSFGSQGQAIYDTLKDNPNLFLMLGGHRSGEGRREDTFNGNTVYSLLANYQSRSNGGNGWLRMMEFSPVNNEIRVKTYSPVLDQFETDADSQFTLHYDMQGSSFQVLGTNTNVPSGANTSMAWLGLGSSTEYEWYVTVDDGNSVTTGTTWSFTTEETEAPVITILGDNPATVEVGGSYTDAGATATDNVDGDLTGAIVTTSNVDTNAVGSYSVTYEVSDSSGNTATAVRTVIVNPVNHSPVAVGDSDSTDEDTAVIIDVAVNDTDPDDNLDPNSANSTCANGSTGCLGAANGSLIDHGDGTITYTPNQNYNGPDSFIYEICDTLGGCDTALVSIAVAPVNDSPVANGDSASTIEETVVAIDVAANDTDPDGNLLLTLTNTGCVSCSNPTNGSLVNNGDGTFDYTPNPGVSGSDSFVYEICDTLGACDTAVVNISVNPSAPVIVEVRVSASTDDAEESGGGISLASSDLELTFDRGGNQTVGMRFNGISIPPGANIANAYIQFQVDETIPTDPTNLTIQGEDHDNAPTFSAANWDISSRAVTGAAVNWIPAPWTAVGQAGPDQQTPNIASVVQEIVNRPGWSIGNSLVIIITGTGERTAESFNGNQAAAPLLHVEYGMGPPVNQAPSVAAGLDQTITLPSDATLDGTVTDDGLPNPPGMVNTTWSQVSGPGLVAFTDASAVDTTATFTVAGVYVLQLTANDGELISGDTLTVTVNPEGTGSTVDIRVTASSDDAEETESTGSMNLTSRDLDLGRKMIGIRFNGVNIPQGATINNAHIQFQADEISSVVTTLTIEGEDIDNALAFTSTIGNISSRARTTASVPWSPVAWTTVGEAGPGQQTPNIATVIQEVVDLSGWTSGNSLVIMITGTGKRSAEAYDGDQAGAPLLHVEYQ